MHLLHSRNPWSYKEGPEPTLNFCLWVLQVDGLRVPPFDQHPDGDGSLRALGLTAEDWQSWFLRALDPEQGEQDRKQIQQQAMEEYLKISGEPDLEHLKQRYRAEQLKISKDPPLPPPPEFHYPYHASWNGNIAIRNQLIELQKEYRHRQLSDQLDKLFNSLFRAEIKEELRSGIRLYDELKSSFASRLPTLTVHHVAYAYPLDYIIPPTTVVMTIQEGQPDLQEHRERVLAAAAELAARPGRSSKQSLYTRIGERTDQLATAYRRYVRKPVPPAPPEPEIPRLDDPVKQMVIESLAVDRHVIYGPVDFTTVQFLREKNRPGWRLYEITFQETDGEQHRQIYIFQENEDGSWHYNGGGSSSDMQNQWSRIFAPVRDHPLIFLAAGWTSLDNQHYFLHTAHGHVIDNGFHVARVLLTNDAGQLLEDVVEDGYVFFACKPEEQVQLPMQAELYDHEGKLVWRQTVPDFGLPRR